MRVWFKRLFATSVVVALGTAVVVTATWEPDRQLGKLVARWAPAPSAFIELDGMQVHVRDTGPRSDPTPIVLLHGMASSLHSWERWQTALSTEHRVITVDLPGFGLTGPSPQGEYRIEAYTRFTLRLLDALGVKRVVLGGNALGGEVAWQTALLAPERVKKLILVGLRVWQMAFTPDEKQLLTTNGISGDVTVIDVASLTPVKSIKVGRYPWGVAVKP